MIRRTTLFALLTMAACTTAPGEYSESGEKQDSLAPSDATCDELLTKGFTTTSKSYHRLLDHLGVELEGPALTADDATAVSLALAAELGCDPSEMDASSIDSSNCSQLGEDAPWSTACYVTTPLGYFFVTNDFFDLATITFNTWD